MPEEVFGFQYKFMPRANILSFEEITRLARLFAELGVSKIRLTGGEPLLRSQLDRLIAALHDIPGIQDIAMTTNCYFLAEKAQILRDAGLNRVTASLDTLRPDLFQKLAGGHLQLEKVMDGLRRAADVGFQAVKVNSVIQRGVNDTEVVDLVRFARDNGLILRFIEYMDVGNLNGWNMAQVVTARELIETVSKTFPLVPLEKNYSSETANRYRFADGAGELGVIASVSQPFCGDCSRIRLSADGKLYTCLFIEDGLDIKSRMRDGATDEELREILCSLWRKRTDRYSEVRASHTNKPRNNKKIEMYQIGG